MGDKAKILLKRSIDAFIKLDADQARRICADDQELDALNREMYRKIEVAIRGNLDRVESFLHLLSVSKYLERIADHATNIAEDIIYMTEGKIVRHSNL